MAQSEAKKQRKKLEREGKRNPAHNRGDWHGVSPLTRLTPNWQETIRKQEQKHKKKWNRTPLGEDGSISFFSTTGALPNRSPNVWRQRA